MYVNTDSTPIQRPLWEMWHYHLNSQPSLTLRQDSSPGFVVWKMSDLFIELIPFLVKSFFRLTRVALDAGLER